MSLEVPYSESLLASSPECNVPLTDWGCELFHSEHLPPSMETGRLTAARADPPSLHTLLGCGSPKHYPSELPTSLSPLGQSNPSSPSPRPISTPHRLNHSSPQVISELKLTASSCDLSPAETPNEGAPPSPATSNDLDFLVGPPGHGPCLRHPEFYFEGLTVTFLVENHLFKVHRFFLERDSDQFRRMIRSPTTPGEDGLTDERAIPLSGVKPSEFESLLDFFYHGMYNDAPRTLQGWINLLSVSTRFGFPRIRGRAVAEISSLDDVIDPVEKIVLAKTYDVPQWLMPSYEILCEREKALEVVEARKLGVDTTALIAQAREAVRAISQAREVARAINLEEEASQPRSSTKFRKGHSYKSKPTESPLSSDLRQSLPHNPSEVSRIVREIFSLEIP